MKNNTFGDYVFDDWVCDEVKEQIKGFWGRFGRTYKDWKDDFKYGALGYGEEACILTRDNKFFVGRYIHAWNNMGRLISKDGRYIVVSTCDEFLGKKPTTMTYSMS